MATRAHDCAKKGSSTVCPSCGRIAPDWCAEDQPEGAQAPVEEPEAPVKIFEGKRGRKAL